MAILSPTQLVNAQILDATTQTQRLLKVAAAQGNAMVSVLLALQNDSLTEWLNSKPMDEISALFADHLAVGNAINSAMSTIGAQLIASGTVVPYDPVDVRSFQDKLAAQGRQIQIIDGAFVVSVLPAS
jgi:hypothetical protein